MGSVPFYIGLAMNQHTPAFKAQSIIETVKMVAHLPLPPPSSNTAAAHSITVGC